MQATCAGMPIVDAATPEYVPKFTPPGVQRRQIVVRVQKAMVKCSPAAASPSSVGAILRAIIRFTRPTKRIILLGKRHAVGVNYGVSRKVAAPAPILQRSS